MSRSRAKGTRFESEVCEYLRAHGHPYAERRALNGKRDRGDIAGIPGVVLECKNHASNQIDLAGAVDEAAVEAEHAGASCFAAIIHRRRRSTAEAYAVMPLSVLAWLLSEEGP